MRARGAVVGLLAAIVLVVGVIGAPAASAHPLGNFTTNTSALLVVGTDSVRVGYVVDLAEIPALQVIREHGLDVAALAADEGQPEGGSAERAYAERACADAAEGLTVEVAGEDAALEVDAAGISFPPGQAGLRTLRLECDLRAATATLAAGTPVGLRDGNFPGRLGWREVSAVGDGMTLEDSDVPATSVSARLTSYPEDRLQSPLDVREAAVTASPGGAAAAGDAIGDAIGEQGDALLGAASRAVGSLTDLVAARELTPLFAVLALLTAVALGAVHALAPGHGKTVMAAFLIGRTGVRRQVLGLGLTVAVTHTAGVLALGALLSVTQSVAPESIFGWLGVASGLLFAGVGVLMLRNARRRGGHGHAHGHRAEHDHGAGHNHGAGHDHHHHRPETASGGWKGMIAPGLAGGMVPSPSALVVLLGGLALGRAWFGVSLVIAYGVGMAATLVGIGLLLVRARDRLARWSAAGGAGSRMEGLTSRLPVAMACLIIVGGLTIAARFAMSPGA